MPKRLRSKLIDGDRADGDVVLAGQLEQFAEVIDEPDKKEIIRKMTTRNLEIFSQASQPKSVHEETKQYKFLA